ncbi:serum opacification factor [Streptococcus uberis]|nr:serum opacification factor [Streptococcus uberis]
MTTTVLGEENTTTTPTTEVTTENQNATSSISNKGDLSNSKTDEVVEETPAPPGITSTVTTELTETTQKNEKEIAKTINEGGDSVISQQTEDASTTGQTPPQVQTHSRSIRSAEAGQAMEAETMEVEKVSVDKEKTEVTVSDEKKLIKNRDDKQRKIFDVKRDVVVDPDGTTLNVTLTVTPKEIDKGAEVIVLLDTSKKMTDDDFNTAKENIKKLVTTLTGKDSRNDNKNPNYNNRNTVRLIDFYRKIGEPINLSGLDANKVEEKLNEVRKKAQEDYNGWGVNLQGAIHRARQAFNSVNEKPSGKRQHIVLFTQGEATQSYEIKEKKDLKKLTVDEPVTYSNPLLPWPLYFDTTTRKANLVEEGKKIQDYLKKIGIKRYDGLLDSIAQNGNKILNFGSSLVGFNNPLNFITMSDLDTKNLSEESFDYETKIGEGYHHRSYYDRESGQVPLDSIVKKAVKAKIKKLKKEAEENSYDIFGLSKWSTSLSKVFGFDTLEEKMVNKFVDYLFYKRNYVYYNHNLSAQAEAKMAREEGINFYVFDVTDPERSSKMDKAWPTGAYGERLKQKVEEARELSKKRNEKFDKYLKEMAEGKSFFKEVENAEKFKDILTELKVTETFTDKVSVIKDDQLKGEKDVKHTPASSNFWLFSTSESLIWTISKEKLKDAFEQRTPLELTYKLKVEKDKFKSASPTRAKRSLETPESNKPITEKAISGKVTYKINGQDGTGKELGDVYVTYSKEKVRKPQEESKVPEAPQLIPLTPLKPSNPIVPAPELPDVEKPEIENESIVPDLPEMEQPDQDSPEISGQSQIVDIVEDTLPGVSGQHSSSEETEISEDTRPESDNEIIVGGQSELVDIVEDTQSGMSGQHSSSEETEISEDTRPESDNEIIVGGQSELVDIVEDTQPSLSGHQSESQETVTVEDTQPNQSNILIGGQSEIVDIIEDTQAGMTGQYSSTDQLTIVEDTLPEQMEETDEIKADSQVMDIPKVNDTNNDKGAKASVAFDVEESKVVSTQDIKPSTYVKGDNQLPQTGDDDKVNAFFTLAALSVIGAAGLRQNKRREKERN